MYLLSEVQEWGRKGLPAGESWRTKITVEPVCIAEGLAVFDDRIKFVVTRNKSFKRNGMHIEAGLLVGMEYTVPVSEYVLAQCKAFLGIVDTPKVEPVETIQETPVMVAANTNKVFINDHFVFATISDTPKTTKESIDLCRETTEAEDAAIEASLQDDELPNTFIENAEVLLCSARDVQDVYEKLDQLPDVPKEEVSGIPADILAMGKIAGLVAEVIGNWVWITGETKAHKEELKRKGFKWSPNKMAWYWRADGYRKLSKHVWSIGECRERFGSIKANELLA